MNDGRLRHVVVMEHLEVRVLGRNKVCHGQSTGNDKIWSLTQFSSVDFSKSRIGVKKWGAFYKPHSAVFKFGGLLRLLDINLTKQDKPIS